MPELPEVETVLRGLSPHIKNTIIQDVIVRQPQLRWPVPPNLASLIKHQQIKTLFRRGKYLIIQLNQASLIIHLGMSGSLQLLSQDKLPKTHDHLDILLSNHTLLRYNDPRRFGAILLSTADPLSHPLLQHLGVEPLGQDFTSDYLKQACNNRRVCIKTLIMNSKIVTGIGNIYAVEALFLAKIHPLTQAKQLSLAACENLVQAIKTILNDAITQGGSTIRDYVNSEGKPGYFAQRLKVYGRSGEACLTCGQRLQSVAITGRGTVFCAGCQSP